MFKIVLFKKYYIQNGTELSSKFEFVAVFKFAANFSFIQLNRYS